MTDQISIISIEGEITYRTIRDIESRFSMALQSPEATIVFEITSTGGNSTGLSSLCEYIYQARADKKIVSVIDTCALSAAYAIAASTSEILVGTRTARLGSIGMFASLPAATAPSDEKVVLSSGIHKTPSVCKDPEHIKAVAAQLASDFYFEFDCFVQDIAKYRGLPVETVKELSGGQCFFAHEAITLGLADGFYDLYAWKRNAEIKLIGGNGE